MGGVEGRSTAVNQTFDPLTMPRPELRAPLILPLDQRAPVEKIVATMPMAVRQLEDPSSLRVIVSLHQPMIDSRSKSASASAKAERLAQIANIEHDFVEAAGRLGFRPEHGLRNFGIVSGEISPDRLIHLAALRQVKAIEPDRVMRANMAEGLPLGEVRTASDSDSASTVTASRWWCSTAAYADHPELGGQVEEHRTFNGPAGGRVQPWDQGRRHHRRRRRRRPGGDPLGHQGHRQRRRHHHRDPAPGARRPGGRDGQLPDPGRRVLRPDSPLRHAPAIALNPAAAQVVNAFRDAGKLLIGSTGNEADGTGIGIPACLDAILATGAVYDANVGSVSFGGCTDATTAADKIACYSNGGPLVDFYAPGHCTRAPSAAGGFDNCFGGTSASAAYVAGVAAQIMGGKSDLTAASVTNAFKSTGPNLTDSRSGISRRRIDGEAAFESLRGQEEPTPTPTPTKTATVQGPGPSPTPTKTATVAPGGVPAAPSNLTAAAVSHTAVLLEWNDNSNNETSFRHRGEDRRRTGSRRWERGRQRQVHPGGGARAVDQLRLPRARA